MVLKTAETILLLLFVTSPTAGKKLDKLEGKFCGLVRAGLGPHWWV